MVVPKGFLEFQAKKVKYAAEQVMRKDSLNENDIQAIKLLVEVYGDLSNQMKESRIRYQEDCNNCGHPELKEK